MKKFNLFFLSLLLLIPALHGQEKKEISPIDRMLILGDFQRAADTCRLILQSDTSNAEIWFKMGLASQNVMPDTGSFSCFLKAFKHSPENNLYKFTAAKGYYIRNKYKKAKPLLITLCEADSLNWQYAHYLTSILVQEGRYDNAIDIYNRFYLKDSGNYVILDKLGFANLKKENYETAIDLYNRSLALNQRDMDAYRNLSYLYPYLNNRDTAIALLTKAISMEPEDIDLYARRATLYFSKDYTKRALNDYLKILSLGDSSFLYLKRIGIGYLNNLQPKLALPFLLKATLRDSTDFETLGLIGQCYSKIGNHDMSRVYYKQVIESIEAFFMPLGATYYNLAQEQKADSLYNDAVQSYSRAHEYTKSAHFLMIIANIYDQDLHDNQKAVAYYKQFMQAGKKTGFQPKYMESIQNRIDYLENKIAEEKARKN